MSAWSMLSTSSAVTVLSRLDGGRWLDLLEPSLLEPGLVEPNLLGTDMLWFDRLKIDGNSRLSCVFVIEGDV